MTDRYEDIIRLPHHVSEKHPRMSLHDRAAQFAPFAALTGFGAEISETARLTDMEVTLSESRKEELNAVLTEILNAQNKPAVSVTYFVPDAKKAGGEYVTAAGRILKFDQTLRAIVMEDGLRIAVESVRNVEICENRDGGDT